MTELSLPPTGWNILPESTSPKVLSKNLELRPIEPVLKARRVSPNRGRPAAGGQNRTSEKTQADTKALCVLKKAHSLVERKYRSNVNENIAALRRLLPRLCEETSTSVEEEQTVQPLCSKRMVLVEAVAHIKRLERQVRELRLENNEVNTRLSSMWMAVHC